MKKIEKIVWVAFGLSTLSVAQWSVDGEFRARFESFENMNEKFYGTNPTLGESDDSYLMTRVRLGVSYKFNENVSFRASLQDSRVLGWGFEDSDWYNKEFNQEHNPQQDNTELYELYLKYQQNNLAITLGRQKITYGDYRVFGPGEWKNSGKWLWDGAKLSYTEGENFVDIFYGRNVLHDPDELSFNGRHGYEAVGVYGHYALDSWGVIEPIFAYKHNDKANEVYNELTSYYVGFRAYNEDIGGFFYDTTYIQSFGDYTKPDGTTVDSKGKGFHIDGGYSFKPLKTKIGFGYTYASGDDPNTQERELFDGVFGASDKYYGRLNLFEWSNLIDYELFVITKALPNTHIKLEYHKFYADKPTNKWKSYTIASMRSDEYGDEIDLVATYDYNKDTQLMLGASYFAAGDYIQEATTQNNAISDDDAYGFFAQVQYKF